MERRKTDLGGWASALGVAAILGVITISSIQNNYALRQALFNYRPILGANSASNSAEFAESKTIYTRRNL